MRAKIWKRRDILGLIMLALAVVVVYSLAGRIVFQ